MAAALGTRSAEQGCSTSTGLRPAPLVAQVNVPKRHCVLTRTPCGQLRTTFLNMGNSGDREADDEQCAQMATVNGSQV
ncbi:hypothetical protein BA059_18475 [Mycolicibacterium sp. (ex Dasyatis americana)]|nr:hypothetical protein BA059_18475 [Mycolicibacterium sp. (ex Dasyatis americana)]